MGREPIIAVGGGDWISGEPNPIDVEICRLAERPSPRALFIGTASLSRMSQRFGLRAFACDDGAAIISRDSEAPMVFTNTDACRVRTFETRKDPKEEPAVKIQEFRHGERLPA